MAKTILLADDSLTIQKVVELTFADTEFEVVATSSGDELLEKIAATAPDVVICDTIMPGIDGYDVCQQIKSDPSTLHIPVVMLTGTFEPFDRDRALAVGCSEIITKPFEARKLVETVKNLVEGGGIAAPAPDLMEGAVKPPEFEGAVVPPAAAFEGAVTAPAEEVEEYGTMMMGSAALGEGPEQIPEEGLDFTTTGFAAMEAAGKAEEESTPPPPESGLDFEEKKEETGFAFGSGARPAGEATQPISAAEIAAGAPEEFDVAEAVEEEPAEVFEEEETDIDTVPPDAFARAEAFAEETAVADGTPEELPLSPENIEESVAAQVEPAAGPEDLDTAPLEEEYPPAAAAVSAEVMAVEENEAAGFAAPEMEEESFEEVEAVAAEAEPAPVEVDEAPQGIAAAPVAAPTVTGSLSDEDVDRIARRVIELASDRLERIAWDLIPDMAEIVVRERIRELEAQLEDESSVH